MIRKILVPVDGSEHSFKAIDFASTLAQPNDAMVHLLHVAKIEEIPKALLDYMRSEGVKETPYAVYAQIAADRILIPAEDEAKRKGIKHIETTCLQGDPAEEIINFAREQDFDLIIMGGRGLGGLKSLMMGSVSTKVSHGTDRTCVIVRKSLLDSRKVLIVDDEPDVLETLKELLPMCEIETASTFEEAKKLLETKKFDLTILDIMGVNGYALLEIANEKKITAVMLTAHALSPEEVVKSHEKGASYYIPKDRMAHIASFLTEILEAKEKGKNTWWRWLERLGSYFENAFGSDWQKKDEKFWNSFPY
jgi:nucleotide-binding universal stress UspA family protein/CheY-like chemotaxis protein